MRVLARSAALVLVPAAILMLTAAPSSAEVDPSALVTCVAGDVGKVTALIDPSALQVPAEVPVVGCLQP
ncbi:hypothetical protein [Actinomadura sp. 6N118]|uniref:hypothetical protein n=1 Tax=Actinomadura sp. 6N118 TaxID=3375151 RepID=UPI0037BD3B6B